MGTINTSLNTETTLIDGVFVRGLRVIPDERGKVMHMLRANAPHFTKFGEVYFSVINPGVVKGWKQHKKMTQNFAVPVGQMELVLFDARPDSKTKGKIVELSIGESNYCLVTIPPGIIYSFKGASSVPVLLVNCADLPHDPEESLVFDLKSTDIPYNWK